MIITEWLIHSTKAEKVNEFSVSSKIFFSSARLGTFGKSLLSEWAKSFHIYPEETWLQVLGAHPRDDLFPSSTSSEAKIFHKLINVVKPNVQKKKKNPSVQKNPSANGNEKITVGESIIIR